MATFREYENYDAIGLAGLIAAGEISAEEALQAAIERLEGVNPRINAVSHKMYDEAHRTIADGLAEGPFSGVPFLLKDLAMLYTGAPTSFGSRLFADLVPDHDSTLVERYRGAGLVIFGKTNSPEMGLAATTEPVAYGPTLNPWNPELSAGGSSGGATAAVAARVLPAAHASDGGGSIRIPSANCGVFGLKPTRARNPAGPDLGEGWSGFSTNHVASRTVRDSAALLDATHGPAPGDPYCAPPPERPFQDEVGADPGRLSIAFSTAAPNGVPVHPEIVQAVTETARLSESLGHRVDEAAPEFDMDAVMRSMRLIWSANTWTNVALRYEALGRTPDGSDLENLTWALAQEGQRHPASDYARALQIVHGLGRNFARFFAGYDVFLTPTMAQPPWPLGVVDMMDGDVDHYLDNMLHYMPFTAQFNATGQPAMSVPLAWTGDGLPIGLQFAGRFGDEATLLRLAGQLEQAKPWAQRRPDV